MNTFNSVEILKALADDTRLAIAKKIACDEAPTPGCELSSVTKEQLSQPTMSHHICKLVEAGVLIERKEGVKKIYSLRKDVLDRIGIDITKL